MNHQRRMRQQLQAFLDGELPEAQRVRLSAHLETCRDCAAGLRRLETGDRLLVEACLDPAALSPAASRALLSRTLTAAAPRGGGPRRGWPLLAWGIVTAVVIGTAGASSWYRPWREAARGSRERTVLADLPPRDGLRSIQNASSPPGPGSPLGQNSISRSQTPKVRVGRPGKPAQPRKETRPAAPLPVPDPLPRPRRPRSYPVACTESVVTEPAPGSELADRLEIEWVSADPLWIEIAVELALAEAVSGVPASGKDEPEPEPTTDHRPPNAEHPTPDTDWLAFRTLASDPVTREIVEELLARSSLSVGRWAADAPTMGILVAEALTSFDANSLPPGEAWPGFSTAASRFEPRGPVTDPGWHSDVAERVEGELLVVASEPPPSPVLVSTLPEGAPGFARAAAFRPDRDGDLTWTQATASTGADGPQLALVMLGCGVWNW